MNVYQLILLFWQVCHPDENQSSFTSLPDTKIYNGSALTGTDNQFVVPDKGNQSVIPVRNSQTAVRVKDSESVISFDDKPASLKTRHKTLCADDGSRFAWSKQQQGHLLSSFYIGMTLGMPLGGFLSQKMSAKYCHLIGILWSAGLSAMMPFAAHYSGTLLFCVRLLQGIANVSL